MTEAAEHAIHQRGGIRIVGIANGQAAAEHQYALQNVQPLHDRAHRLRLRDDARMSAVRGIKSGGKKLPRLFRVHGPDHDDMGARLAYERSSRQARRVDVGTVFALAVTVNSNGSSRHMFA